MTSLQTIPRKKPRFTLKSKTPNHLFRDDHLALGLLSQSDPPVDHELRLIAELAEQEEWWPHVQRTVLWSKLPWFDALYRSGDLAKWLSTWTDDEPMRGLLTLFRPITEHRGDAIDKLLAPFWNRGKAWTDRLAAVFWVDPSDDSPAMAEYRLQRVRSGEWQLNDIYLDRIADRHPRRVVPLIEAVLHAWVDHLTQYRRDSEHNDLPRWPLRDRRLDDTVLDAVRADADRAWAAFAPSLRLMTTLRRLATRGFRSIEDLGNRNWQLRHAIDGARDSLQVLMTAAVEGLARNKPDRLASMLSSLAFPKLRGMEHAIAKGLLAAIEEHADFVLSWLCTRTSRFRLADGHHEVYWEPARALIQRFSPHCSDAVFGRLETEILHYHDRWEYMSYESQLENLRENRLFGNDWGHAQNVLLGALPFPRMSERGRLVARAWRVKFGDPAEEQATSTHSVGGWVTSPIPPDRLMFVNDRDWLKIIRGQWAERESRRWRKHGPDVVGEASVRHFADALGNATKRDAQRFAALALRISTASDPQYFTSIVHALADPQTPADDPSSSEVGPERLEAIIEHVGNCTDAGYVQAVCRLIQTRTGIRWSDAVVDRIVGFVRHPEPAVGTFTVHTRIGPDIDPEPDIAMTAINCVRGCVASAITHLLWTRPDAFDRLVLAAERLLDDAHPAVRHETLGACLPIMSRDKDLAIRLTIAACGHDDDRVLESRWLNKIIGYARSTHLEQIGPLLLRMVRSTNNDVAESGAMWTTACWIDHGRFAEVVNDCQVGSKAQRIGVIAACADYFAAGRAMDSVGPILGEMFNGVDSEVRSRAAMIFRFNDVFDISQTVDLASKFVASPAFLDDPGHLLHPLSGYTGNIELYATVILESADRVSSTLADHTLPTN